MKRARAYLIVLLVFIGMLVLSFTPYFAATKGWWHVDRPMQFYSVLATFIGVDIAVTVLTFGLLFLHESAAFREEIRVVTDRLPASTIKQLSDRAFYPSFLAAVADARDTVRIAYFNTVPPSTVQASGRSSYYREMSELMRARSTVQFFRLVRYSPAVEQWILELIRDFTDVPNVSIAVIAEDLRPEKVMPLALSVQVVDGAQAWLVAIESHEREGPYRDIYVESAPFADAMTKYYKRLWSVADEVLVNGKITELGTGMAARFDRANGGS